MLRSWVVDNDLTQQVADGESGFAVRARISKVFRAIADSLTAALGQLCTLGRTVWGTLLPHTQPFLIEWDGFTWHCPPRSKLTHGNPGDPIHKS